MKLSEILIQRLNETQSALVDLKARQAALVAEKRALLAAPTVDTKVLAKLEVEEQHLPVALASQETRLDALTCQLREAVKNEGQERAGEIEHELSAIASRISTRRTAFLKGIEELLALIRDDAPDRRRDAGLRAEAQYLHEAFAAPWPQAPLAIALNSNDLNVLTAEFRKSHWVFTQGHEWTAKTEALVQQRAREERSDLDAKKRRSASEFPQW